MEFTTRPSPRARRPHPIGHTSTHAASPRLTPRCQGNDIFSNKGVGVSIGTDGVPNVWGNRIYGGHTAGIYIRGERSRGDIQDNEIYENVDGIVLRDGACPYLEKNTVRDQTRRGVIICARGQGMLVNNTISGSMRVNVEVTTVTTVTAVNAVNAVTDARQRRSARPARAPSVGPQRGTPTYRYTCRHICRRCVARSPSSRRYLRYLRYIRYTHA